MNADEIREMEAGREMDTLVAEKVMGWSPITYETDDNGWQPSTDIADAMQIFECDKFNHFVVDRVDDRSERYQARCATPFFAESAWSDTAPLAICRAALLTALE